MDEKTKDLTILILDYLKEEGGAINLNGTEFEWKGDRIKITT